MTAPCLVVAYHGCDAATRESLLSGETRLRLSANPYDWLGDGAYFFEGDWRRAYKFAAAACRRPSERLSRQAIRSPAVVGAILRVGHWLDMSTQAGIEEFEKTYLALVAEGAPLKANKAARCDDTDIILRLLDRQVFNELHRRRQKAGERAYDAVRGPFEQGEPVALASSICRDTHLQIALRNEACVLGYFRVMELMAGETSVEAMMGRWRES